MMNATVETGSKASTNQTVADGQNAEWDQVHDNRMEPAFNYCLLRM